MKEHELKDKRQERLVGADDLPPPPVKSSEQAEAFREILKAASSSGSSESQQSGTPNSPVNIWSACVNNVALRVLFCVGMAWVGVCAFHSYVTSCGLSISAQTMYCLVGMMAPLDPNQAGYVMGGTDFMDARYEQAISTLNLVSPRDRWQIRQLYRTRADANAGAGHYHEALADLDKLAAAYKMGGYNVASLERERAFWNQAAGRYEAAAQDYTMSESTWAHSSRHWLQMDSHYARSEWGVYGQIPDHFSSSFYVARSYRDKIIVDTPLMYSNWAACEVQLGRYQDAIERCDIAIRMRRDCSPAYKTKALAELRLGKLDPALADCNRALQIDPSYAAALSCRADVFDKMGRKQP
ncbi:MAG TPA: tetratricopeptide repeat protein [Candidatus Obscuribacterales bacterium]